MLDQLPTLARSELNLAEELIGVDAYFFESNPNLLTRFLAYFSWDMKIPYFCCFTWRPRKSFSFPTMLILNSFFISSENSWVSASIDEPNTMSSMYTWATRRHFSSRFTKRVWLTWPLLKPQSKRYVVKRSYYALGACFNPYSTFFNRRTWSRK